MMHLLSTHIVRVQIPYRLIYCCEFAKENEDGLFLLLCIEIGYVGEFFFIIVGLDFGGGPKRNKIDGLELSYASTLFQKGHKA